MTVAVAVLLSRVVARLLTPLMAAYLLKPLGGTKKPEERERDHRYAKAVDWALGQRWATAGIGAFLFIFALFLARSEEHTSDLQSLMRMSSPVFCVRTKNR